MKIGIEVEGRLRGVPTLFVSASDVWGDVQPIHDTMDLHKIRHLYISDRDNVLAYNMVGDLFSKYLVTMDVTKAYPIPRPRNVTLILTLPYELWDSVKALGPDDQIKFHSPERNVACVSARNLVHTSPREFEEDIEV